MILLACVLLDKALKEGLKTICLHSKGDEGHVCKFPYLQRPRCISGCISYIYSRQLHWPMTDLERFSTGQGCGTYLARSDILGFSEFSGPEAALTGPCLGEALRNLCALPMLVLAKMSLLASSGRLKSFQNCSLRGCLVMRPPLMLELCCFCSLGSS